VQIRRETDLGALDRTHSVDCAIGSISVRKAGPDEMSGETAPHEGDRSTVRGILFGVGHAPVLRIPPTFAAPLPTWAVWLLEFGRRWAVSPTRQIAILSMPSDSAAAGLVTLGALIGDLGRPEASDVDGHFDALLRYAKQYLSACRDCPVRCRPKERQCGYSSEATGKLRHRSGHLLGPITAFSDSQEPTIVLRRSSGTVSLHQRAGMDYSIQHEPPIQTLAGEGLDPFPFTALMRDCSPVADNLRRTYSGLCLIGRAAGSEPTRMSYKQLQFEISAETRSLADLLTLRAWGEKRVSRATFFNQRSGQFDRPRSFTKLAIADGAAALEVALARGEFERCDVIGVLHRTEADEVAKPLGERIAGMRQWYDTVQPQDAVFETTPRGIAVKVLRRRS
jgi:hypothetical protein